MSKNKKSKNKKSKNIVTDMKAIAALKASTPGALPEPAAPFNMEEAPHEGPDESPMETLDVTPEELGAEVNPVDVVENEDGSADVYIDPDANVTGDIKEFYVNLATCLDPQELDSIGERYIRLIEDDIEARKERDKQQEEGLKRAGMGGPAPGGADFDGASRVTHPVLAEAYVDFSASAMKELFPSAGPVRTYIAGTVTDEKLEKAQRKRDYMNWQLTHEIVEYRSELESMLTQLPAGGSQFMKIFWSKDHGRAMVDFVPIDDFILPFSAKSYVRSQRKFHRLKKSQFEFQQDVDAGLYVSLDFGPPPDDPQNTTRSEAITDKIEGKDNNYSQDDNEYVLYEGSVWEKFAEDPLRNKDRACPYIITIDEHTHKVIGLYRNWDPNQEPQKYEEQKYIVKFGFIPWRGAYDIGLPHLIGDLAASLTGALRALLDSAHIQNSAAGVKLKGRPSGQTVSMSPTQVGEVDAIGADDVRKVFMPLPFAGPSPVLLQLLGYLTDAAKGVVSTSEEKIADAGGNMPVGTTIALIEQGAKVFSSIHARLHHSQAECLEIIHRLNRQHIKDRVKFGEDDKDYVTREDFEGPLDVIPVSDPNIFSETQRFAQIQAVISLRASFPNVLDDDKILTRMFQLMKLPDYNDLFSKPPPPKPTHPAAENVYMAMGKPSLAFPEQDHIAHIQVHLDFLKHPMFGQNILISKVLIPSMTEHVKQHILFYYADLMRLEGKQQLGEDISDRAKKDKSWQTDRDISDALAKSSEVVMKTVEGTMQGVPPVIQQAMETMQKLMQPPMPNDPATMVAMKDIEQRAEAHKEDLALAAQRLQKDVTKMQNDFALKQATLQAQMDKVMKTLETQLKKANIEATTAIAEENIRSATELKKADDNNSTALQVAVTRGSEMTTGDTIGDGA